MSSVMIKILFHATVMAFEIMSFFIKLFLSPVGFFQFYLFYPMEVIYSVVSGHSRVMKCHDRGMTSTF